VTCGILHWPPARWRFRNGSIQAEKLAIEQINAMGGILVAGQVHPEDGASDWPDLRPRKAKKLLVNDKVAAHHGLLDLGLPQGGVAGRRAI